MAKLDPEWAALVDPIALAVAKQLRENPIPIFKQSPWLTTKEAAHYLGLRPKGVSNMRDNNRGPKYSLKGLIAADVTNNAVVGGALVPLLTLGIPGSGSMAVLLVVMTYHGMYVGPRLFHFSGEIAYAVLISQFFAAGFILFIGTALAFFAYRIALFNLKMMVPIISVFCLMGGFARNNFLFDMGVMVAFGLLGFMMKRYKYPVVAMLLGVILGRLFEREFMRAWRIGMDGPELFFSSPIALILWALFIFTFVGPPLIRFVRRKLKSDTPPA